MNEPSLLLGENSTSLISHNKAQRLSVYQSIYLSDSQSVCLSVGLLDVFTNQKGTLIIGRN